MLKYKVCPDYMSSGLMVESYINSKGESVYTYFDEEDLPNIISHDTRQLLALCQQIFDQTDSWSSKSAYYKFPHFIRREQYEILCWVVARRVESETGVPTIAGFYWSTDNV